MVVESHSMVLLTDSPCSSPPRNKCDLANPKQRVLDRLQFPLNCGLVLLAGTVTVAGVIK